MTYPAKISIENVPFEANDSKNKSFALIHAANSWQSEYSKKCYFFISIDFRIFNSPPLQVRLLPSRSQSKTEHLYKSFQPKLHCLSFFVRFLMSQKVLEKPFIFCFPRYSNPILSKTAGVISSIRVGRDSFLVLESYSMGELSICVRCIRVLLVLNYQKSLFKLTSLDIQTCIPQNYNFEIFHRKINLKYNTCKRVLGWKTVEFKRSIGILIIRNF